MSESNATTAEKNTAKAPRNLKTRHLNMISLGAAVGTGLFAGSAESIQAAGPAVLISFAVCGFVVFLIMRMLGEMAVTHPISGSFSAYARKYLGPVGGFVTGWNWWLVSVIVSMIELLVISTVFMPHLLPALPKWATVLIILAVIVAVNVFNVRSFAETEFVLSAIKVIAIIALIVVGLIVAFVTGTAQAPAPGFANLSDNGGFFAKGIQGILLGLVPAVFSFGGVESIGMAAGEVENPEKSIPKAINTIIWRIMLFYIGGVGVVLLLLPWSKVDDNSSPFVDMLNAINFPYAGVVLNVIMIIAACSVLNTLVFAGARTLRTLAEQGQAPKFFAVNSTSGVPLRAIALNTLIVAAITPFIVLGGPIFLIMIGILTGVQIVSWLAIVLSHHVFVKTNENSKRLFLAPLRAQIAKVQLSTIICVAFFIVLLGAMSLSKVYVVGVYVLLGWVVVLAILWLAFKTKK